MNYIIIIILLFIPIYFLSKKLTIFLINRKKRDIVRQLLPNETSKTIIHFPSNNIKILSQLMTPKYFANVFYKEYVNVTKYNIKEPLSIMKYLGLESSQMEANYYFNLCKNNMASNLFMKNTIPKKYWNNFIIPEFTKFLNPKLTNGYPNNIRSIDIIICGLSLTLPSQYFLNDILISIIQGSSEISYINPKNTQEHDPMTCFPFIRKNIEPDSVLTVREGDFLYLPNGYVCSIECKGVTNVICLVEFDNFRRECRRDKEIDLIKMEQLQMRKIARRVYPKNLEKDELEILWKMKIINGNVWEKNQIINNIL